MAYILPLQNYLLQTDDFCLMHTAIDKRFGSTRNTDNQTESRNASVCKVIPKAMEMLLRVLFLFAIFTAIYAG